MNSSEFPSPRFWSLPAGRLDFGKGAMLVGILNCTPDSFSGDKVGSELKQTLTRARAMLSSNAAIIDIGGESTRPDSKPVPAEGELERVIPVIGAIRREFPHALLSLDTRKAVVAQAGIEVGVDIINDISTLADPDMARVVAESKVGLVISHLRGEPATMQNKIHFEDVVTEVAQELAEAAEHALACGIGQERLVLDPGLGFGKKTEHNLALLRDLNALRWRNRPLLVGLSRKRFLGEITGIEDPQKRDFATAVSSALLAQLEVELIRVHDVESSRQALALKAAFAGKL